MCGDNLETHGGVGRQMELEQWGVACRTVKWWDRDR